MFNKTVMILFILITLIILLKLTSNINKENYENNKVDEKLERKEINTEIEVIENIIITTSFNNKLGELTSIKLDELVVVFDNSNIKNGLTINNNKFELKLKPDTLYTVKLVIYPLSNLLVLLIKEDKENYKLLRCLKNDKEMKAQQKLLLNGILDYSLEKSNIVLLEPTNELYRLSGLSNKYLNSNKNKLELLSENELGDKKTVIWNIEKNKGKMTIRNIVNNLYLSINNGELVLDATKNKTNEFYIFEKQKTITVINEEGYVLNLNTLEQSNDFMQINYEIVENIGNWITYNSAINLINAKNLYVSGNINVKYEKTNTAMIYIDSVGQKELIQWVIEDYKNLKKGFYVKENDEVYLKNNGYYLQILKGNNSPSNSGFEVSLGEVKNDNSKWIVNNVNSERLLRKGGEVYLYHPKMQVYLYATDNLFKVLEQDKQEVIGINKKYKWKFDLISKESSKIIKNDVDYFKYTNDKNYFEIQDNEWKKKLFEENEKTKKNLNKYKQLQEKEKYLEQRMNEVNNDIINLEKEKCPPRKVCLEKIHYDCIPKTNERKEVDNKLYDIVFVKEQQADNKINYLNAENLNKCKTINDFDIESSYYVKSKKYIPKKEAKLDITDFKLSEFPEYNDLVSIETIPEDKKITDFKINELIGFDKLKLKPQFNK